MIRSVLRKSSKVVFTFAILLAASVSLCFVDRMTGQDWLVWGNRCLTESYDQSADIKLKKLELTLTDGAFIRLRKTYQNGKQEYFSLHLQKLDDMEYLGNTVAGTLHLKTRSDDIIVQTYNDRKGDVDSMASVLVIPVKNIQPERLDSLQVALSYFKNKAL